VPAERSH
jgi:DNA-binding SARP family transcriptional activator